MTLLAAFVKYWLLACLCGAIECALVLAIGLSAFAISDAIARRRERIALPSAIARYRH